MKQYLTLWIGIHVLTELCETAHMNQRKSQNEVLDELVLQGTITEEQACEIADAPHWSFSARELVTYLAALIISVGVIRILAIAFEDASEGAIVTALYIVSVATAFASWKLSGGSVIRHRFSEVLELGSLGSAVGATAVVLSHTDLRGESIAAMLSAAGLAWGLFRCRESQFAGTVAMCVSANALAISLGTLINSDRAWPSGLLMVVSGSFLAYIGTLAIGSKYLSRAVGALFVLIGSINLGADVSNGRFIPIVTGIALFAVGTSLLAPEMLVTGAICIVVGVVMTVTRWIHNDMAQGFVIIGTGVAMLAALSTQMKRITNRPMTGTRVA